MTTLFKELSRKEKTLFKKDNAKVKVNYFWDSHGRLVGWEVDGKKSNTYQGNVEIKQLLITRQWTYTPKPTEEEYWNLFVNGKKVDDGDVSGYSYNPETNVLNIKLICGWG